MAKKNFDDFVNAAGKRKKPSPEEVDELSKIIHPAATAAGSEQPSLPAAPPKIKPTAPKTEAKSAETKTAAAAPPQPRRQKTPRGRAAAKRNLDAPPTEKVRITVDLAKDLYKRMKMQLVHEEIDISTYVRDLIERDLSRK